MDRDATGRPHVDQWPGADEQLEQLAPLWREMVEHHRDVSGGAVPVRDPDASWAVRREEYRRWLVDGTGTVFVARRAATARPEGYAFVRMVASGPTFDFGAARGEVESLVVARAARGAGLGSALLAAVRAELRRRGCTWWSLSVMEHNHAAVRVYERAGFRPWMRELAAPLDAEPGVDAG